MGSLYLPVNLFSSLKRFNSVALTCSKVRKPIRKAGSRVSVVISSWRIRIGVFSALCVMFLCDLICTLDLAFTYFIDFSFSSFSTFILPISQPVELVHPLTCLIRFPPLHLLVEYHPLSPRVTSIEVLHRVQSPTLLCFCIFSRVLSSSSIMTSNLFLPNQLRKFSSSLVNTTAFFL